MSSGETLMVVSTFEPLSVGQEFEVMPEHMTWASSFNLPPARREDFALTMHDIIEENRPPRPIGGSSEIFGDEELGFDSVRRFNRASEGFNVIQDFHAQAALYAFITSVDPNFDTKYFGVRWNPHTKRAVAEGEEVVIDNLTVFKKDTERRRKVVRDVYLWGAHS